MLVNLYVVYACEKNLVAKLHTISQFANILKEIFQKSCKKVRFFAKTPIFVICQPFFVSAHNLFFSVILL
jgi:hypothetical protein